MLEADETVLDGLVREVAEETGLEVLPERLTGVYKNLSRTILALVFRCSVLAGEPRVSQESQAVEWLTAQQVKDRMAEAFAVRLLDATSTGDVAVRHHDGVHIL